jgi:hypothetical protein
LKDIRRKYIKEPEEKNLIKVRLKLKVPNILALVRIFCPIHDIPFPLLQLSSWEAFCLEASTNNYDISPHCAYIVYTAIRMLNLYQKKKEKKPL